MKEKDITFGNYSPEFKPTPLSSTGDTPVDFYSWGENPSGGLITRKQQMDAKLEKAFDSIEISEDPTTPETDYVLKVLGKDAGRLVMPIDSIINNAYYDNQTQELVLVISMGDTEKEIRINVKELVDDYKGDDATISIDENNVISIKKEVMDKFTDLYKSISDEAAAREAADAELQNSIATTLSGSKSYTDSEIAKEVARAKEAENTLKDSKADKEHTHQISEVETLQTVLDTKLTLDEVKAILNEQIYKLFKTVVVDTADFNTADTTNPNESYALVGDGETISMTQSKSFIGKSVKLGNVNLSSESSTKSVLNIVANDSELDNLTLSGTWSRSVGGNTMISLNNAQNVTVSDVEVSRTGGYNAVEIGLDGKGTVKSVVIDGLEISSSLSNNGINIFSFEDNANIVIKNCHFTEVSNPIRISNMTYAKNVNITIQDCIFDSWESGTPAYAGLVLLQDHTSTSTEVFNEKNPFATFNITIDNVTGPYGKIASGQNMEDICASQNAEKQLVYMYVDKATPTLIPYASDKYPTITIK